MLIDQLVSHPLMSKPLAADLRGRMSKAHKFALRQDFAVAADELSRDKASINRALSLCRLPYRECWFEVAQADRCSFRLAFPSQPDAAIRRVGFYFNEDDQAGSWEAHIFWSWADGAPAECAELPGISPLTLQFDQDKVVGGGDLMDVMAWGKASWVPGDITTAGLFEASPFLMLRRGGREEWFTGEAKFLVAMLALLNSRNVVEIEEVAPSDRLNQWREREGRSPLFSYHVLGIPARYKARNIAVGGEASGRELRAHFVRGHFKVRKTGVFFWSAYRRGNPALGFVHKDYALGRAAA
jgi:hypothetical protein